MRRIVLHWRQWPQRFLSAHMWRRALVFWLGALAVGLLSVFFAAAANRSQMLFVQLAAQIWWLPLLVTPLGFLLSGYLCLNIFPGAQGSGIPQVIAARAHPDGWLDLLSPQLVIGKILLTILGLLCGASIGREGPTVQVGAAIMRQAARIGGIRRERGLVLAGAAAGIAAAFNTPLAGIVFAIEEMSRSFEQRTNGLVLYAVIIAGLCSRGLVGNYTYFGASSAVVSSWGDWAMVMGCGVLGGAAGAVFSLVLLSSTRRLRGFMLRAPHMGLAFVFGCGLAVAVIGVATHGATIGTGYEQAREAVTGHAQVKIFWLAKFFATLITAVSGLAGGIFAPSLAVGAGLGSWLQQITGLGAANVVAVLGMAGYFAGVTQAPMTAFVIIVEMTGNDANVIPVMVAAMLGYGTAKILSPESLYHGLAEGFAPAE